MAYVSNTDPAIKRLQKQGVTTGGADAPSTSASSGGAYVSDTDPAIRRLRGESAYTPSYSDPLIEAARGGSTPKTPTQTDTPNLNINAFGANPNAGKRAGDVLGAAVTGGIGNFAEALGQITQPTGLTIGENARLAAEGKGTQAEVMKAETEKADRIRENIKEPLYDFSDRMQAQSQQYTEAAKEGLGKVGQFAVDASIGGAQLAGDILLGAINPALGTAALATRAFGGSAQEARQAGATETQQQLYGTASAATSILVEKIAQVGKLFKGAYGGSIAGGSVDDILTRVIGKVTKNPTLQRILGSAIGEGGEEALEALIQPALQAIYDKGESLNKTWFTDNSEEAKEYLAEVGYNALIGGTLGLVGAGGNANVATQGAETTQNAQNGAPNAPASRVGVEGDNNAPAPQNGTEASVGAYRGDVPQNIENPHIGRLEMSSAPYNPDGKDSSSVYGNDFRDEVRNRAIERLGIKDGRSAYLAAPNITKDGKEYYVDISRPALNKILYTEEHQKLDLARLLLVDNIEKAIDNSYWVESNPDRRGRPQIDGFDTLRTTFYVDGVPHYADIRVKVVRTNKNGDSKNMAYFLEPEEVKIAKKRNAPSATGGRHAPNIFFTDNASIEPTVTPPDENVKRDVFAEDVRNRAAERNDSVGAARAGFDPFSAAENKYGVIDGKARSVRMDDVPRSVDGVKKVSETVSTVKGAEATPEDFVPILETETMKGEFSFMPITNNETVQAAVRKIRKEGFPKALENWRKSVHGGRVSQNTVVIGQLLYNNAVNSGDTQLALDILADYQQMGRSAARALQAMSIMQKLTPESRLYMIRRSVRNMVESLGEDVKITIPEELEQRYLNAQSDAEADAVLDEIAKNVALQIPSTFQNIWTTLRYTNMLGNFKTQVRNIFGNVGMLGVSGVKNAVSAGLERIAGTERTRSVFADKSLREVGKADFDAVKSVVLQQGKYQEGSVNADNFAQLVEDARQVNTTGNKYVDMFLTPLQKYSKATQWAMNNEVFGDAAFAKKNYARALSGYLKAQGITAEQWNDPAWQEENKATVRKAREFAVKDAQENTFRDSNKLSDWISRIGRRADTPSYARAISEGLAPFRRTPANIMLRAEEYSPLGLINTAVKAAQKAKGVDGVTGNDVIEQLAKSLTGTGLFALGMLGAMKGVLRGADDDDEKQAAFDDLRGHQPYSIEIGDQSFTLDWLTPASMPLFMGVEMMNALADNGLTFSDVEKSLTSIAQPMLEMSMMSGISDALDNVQYAENNLMQLALETAVGYLTQGLTNTLAGQIERTLEPNRMTTYIDKNKDVPSWLQYQLGRASAKGLGEYGQTEYIDAWGRTESGGNIGQRAFNNFLAPWYSDTVSDDPLEREVQRIYDATGENVLPERAPKSFTHDKQEVNLTAEQYTEYATTRGNELYDLMQKVVQSSTYKGASDSEKAEMLADAKTYADKKAKAEMGYRDKDSWATKADSAGIDPAAYIQYMLVTDGLTADKDANGKTISGSKKEKVMAKINAMNITNAQKDALYLIEGYSENTISDAPWR